MSRERIMGPSSSLVLGTSAFLVLVWGTTWGAISISLEGFPPFKGIALRFGLAAAFLFVVARILSVPLGKDRREPGLWLVQAFGSYAIPYSIVYWAQQWVPSGLTSILWSTFPLFVTLVSIVALPEERLTRRGWVGVLLGFAGICVIFSEDLGNLGGEHVTRASLVLLLSPLASAISQVVVKKRGRGIHPLSMTVVPMAGCAVLVGALALVVEGGRPILWSPGPVVALAYLAVAGSALTFTLYFWLLQHVSSTRLSLIAYCIPVVAVTLGVLFLGETMTPRILLGGMIVLSGVGMVASPKS